MESIALKSSVSKECGEPEIENNTNNLANSYTTPWTLRAFDALPGSPISIGTVFAFGLLVAFFFGRAIVGGGNSSTSDDLRIAITQILMVAYSASAYAYLLMTVRRTAQELSPIVQNLSARQAMVDRAGKHPGWVLLLVGAASYLLIGIGVTNVTTPEPTNPWAWQGWSYDVSWHRVTTVFFTWWTGCFCYVIMADSARLSRLSNSIETLDLLDMQPYQPLIRQGLTNALLVIGAVSVLSLLGVESRYWPALVGFWIGFTVLAWIGLMLPLLGIRRKFKSAKNQELEWGRQRLKASRDALKSGSSEGRPIADAVAYLTMIENLSKWPFDNSTLVRFTLYLLIPLGSWLGGALVERGLDLILS